MKAKSQYNADMDGVAPQYTRAIPLAVYNRLYADDNRLMSQNMVAKQYRMTPSAIGWLVKENILLPRFVVTEDNSDRVLMKLFASADVDFVAGMRKLTKWDYVGLSEYWRGRVEFPEGVFIPIDGSKMQIEYAVRPLVSAGIDKDK